jgi:hypothetical protein
MEVTTHGSVVGDQVLQLRVDDSVFLIDKKDREDVVPRISGDGMS